VEVDENALALRGLTLDRVAAVMQSADTKVAAGRVSGHGSDLVIEVAGELDSLERVRQIIVATSPTGSAVRVSDLGEVYKAAASPPPAMALTQGRPGILVGVVMEEGRQVDRWSASFRAMLAEYDQLAPAGIDLTLTYDQSIYTTERLRGVIANLAMGIALVLLVMLFTLGWRAAVVVALILPLCGLMSITVLERMGMALHQMSITGLIVSLGLLVDGSIVMTDEIRKRLLKGHSPADAIGSAVQRLRVPLLASAATTILAFLPMAIVPGPAGDFLGSIATAVIIMLVSSTVLALIFTPVLAAWLLPLASEQRPAWYHRGIDAGRMGDLLSRAMDWSLQHPLAAVALALVLPVSGFLAFPTLTAQFFPGTDRDQLYLQVKLADGRSINETHRLVQTLDQRLRREELVRRVDWSIGESAPPFYYNMFRFKQGIPSWAEALVLTHDARQTDALIRRLQVELDREFPEARIVVRGIDQGPPVIAPLEIELHGPNLEELRRLGEAVRVRMESIPYVTHTSAELSGGAPKLVFRLDEAQLRLARLQPNDLARTLDQSLRGATGGEILEGTERLPVRVRLRERDWAGIEQISDLRIPAALGQGPAAAALSGMPLNAVARPVLVPAQSAISHRDGERINTVQAYIERGVLPQEALKLLQAELSRNPVELPPGYRFEFGGDTDERRKVVEKIMAPMGLIVAALLATIVLTFNSWRLSGIALLVCVCSLGLSLLSLAIFRYPFGIQAVIGVIGSIGVSINAAIIIMTALQRDPGAMRGGLYAVRNVVMDSSRHIVSTTVTTFGGFLPLILEGNQFWPPFAMAIAGGVLLSTIISFFLVPPMFCLAYRLRPFRGAGRTAGLRSAFEQKEEAA
jgi:multidrug efflux pump subunit AcrB